MMALITAFLPADVSPIIALLLVVTAFVTAMITAAFSLGGGVAMLAVAANVLPLFAVIPIHGAVQFSSNVVRAVLYRNAINWPIFAWFTLGALIGGVIGINVFVALSRPVLQLMVGLFVLYSALARGRTLLPLKPVAQSLSGLATTFATLFVGATGPLVAALLPRKDMAPAELLGTHGALLAVQHGFKILLFVVAGFAFAPWIGLLAAMMIMGLFGNFAGRAIHRRVSEGAFRLVFNILLAALALRLIGSALVEWWWPA